MTKERWDPDASTATAYSWFVWSKLAPAPVDTRLVLIPPRQRSALSKSEDRARFAGWSTANALPFSGRMALCRRRKRQNPAEEAFRSRAIEHRKISAARSCPGFRAAARPSTDLSIWPQGAQAYHTPTARAKAADAVRLFQEGKGPPLLRSS